MSARLDRLTHGASDFIVTKELLEHGSNWDADAVAGMRYVVLGTLAYLTEVATRSGCEDEFNAILVRLADEIGGD